jgi:hypothetical protein
MSTNTQWTKAARSGGNGGQCVEVRRHDGTVQLRDSKDPHGPVLSFEPEVWSAFLASAKGGDFDLT